MRTFLTAVGLAGLLVLELASPATAHAALVGTDPEPGARLEALPRTLTFEFSEPVGTSSEVAVTAPDGSLVEVGAVAARDREVFADLPVSTQDGEYLIAYRVVSADGHAVSGSFEVTVAAPATSSAQAAPSASPAAADVSQSSFVHRHTEHLAWGGLVAVAALVLLGVPLLRERRS